MTETDRFKPDSGGIRELGILTAIGLGAFVFGVYVLSGPVSPIVGGLAILLLIGAGSQFFFQVANFVSMSLKRPQRTLYQVAISLAVPIAFTLALASRADAVPPETLVKMLTPWRLIPTAIIGWICWYAGERLDQEHPFRGFLITSAVLFALSFMYSMGFRIESDGEESYSYLDPERAKRARETGEHVWTFVLNVTTAYVALLAGRRWPTFWHVKRRAVVAAVILAAVLGGYYYYESMPPDRETRRMQFYRDHAAYCDKFAVRREEARELLAWDWSKDSFRERMKQATIKSKETLRDQQKKLEGFEARYATDYDACMADQGWKKEWTDELAAKEKKRIDECVGRYRAAWLCR